MMARDNGLSPTVTIPSVSPPDIGRLLDAGALGFCLCHAESTEQVEALVRAMKYPPLGARALAHGPNADYRIDDAARYCAEANEATLVMLKIETRRPPVRRRSRAGRTAARRLARRRAGGWWPLKSIRRREAPVARVGAGDKLRRLEQ